MGKVATSTCTRCHEIKPRTEMKQIKKTENSGFSFSGSTNRKGIQGRQYYRNKKVWVCKSCSGGGFMKTLSSFFWLTFGAFILYIIIVE